METTEQCKMLEGRYKCDQRHQSLLVLMSDVMHKLGRTQERDKFPTKFCVFSIYSMLVRKGDPLLNLNITAP